MAVESQHPETLVLRGSPGRGRDRQDERGNEGAGSSAKHWKLLGGHRAVLRDALRSARAVPPSHGWLSCCNYKT